MRHPGLHDAGGQTKDNRYELFVTVGSGKSGAADVDGNGTAGRGGKGSPAPSAVIVVPLIVVAALLRIPSSTAFDYEWAAVQHNVNCRLARAVVVPDAIPPERLRRYGAGPRKLHRYPGLKEEYYLADFEPDAAVLDELGIDRERALAVVRTRRGTRIFHAKG